MMRKLRCCAASCSALALRCARRLLATKQVILPMPTLAPGYISAFTHPVQTGTVHNSSCPSPCVVPEQIRIPPALDCLKAGSYLHSYQSRYSGMHRDCHGYVKRMQRELHGMYTGSPREYYKTRECGHTSSYEWANSIRTPQLRTGELHSHSPATNRANSIRTPQLRMGEQVRAERRPLHNFPRPIIRGCKMS